MTATQRPYEDRLDRVERILAEMAAAQAEANVAHQNRMAELEKLVAKIGERVDRLAEQQQRTNQDVSVIKGWQTEAVVARNARDIFARLAPNGILMRMFPKDEMGAYMNAATRNNYMTRDEVDKAGAIDFLMEGTNYEGAPVAFAVEVSYTAGMDDIRRAVERAPLIAKMLGRDVVLPAVAAEVISETFEDDARTYHVHWAYVPNGNSIMQ